MTCGLVKTCRCAWRRSHIFICIYSTCVAVIKRCNSNILYNKNNNEVNAFSATWLMFRLHLYMCYLSAYFKAKNDDAMAYGSVYVEILNEIQYTWLTLHPHTSLIHFKLIIHSGKCNHMLNVFHYLTFSVRLYTRCTHKITTTWFSSLENHSQNFLFTLSLIPNTYHWKSFNVICASQQHHKISLVRAFQSTKRFSGESRSKKLKPLSL